MSVRPTPACAGFLEGVARACSAQRLDVAAQATLVARRFILVDQAATGITIHDRLGRLVGRFGRSLVFRLDRFYDFLDRRAQHRARAGVAGAALFGLTRALLRGFDVGQGKAPPMGVKKGRVSVWIARARVNVLYGAQERARREMADVRRRSPGSASSAEGCAKNDQMTREPNHRRATGPSHQWCVRSRLRLAAIVIRWPRFVSHLPSHVSRLASPGSRLS